MRYGLLTQKLQLGIVDTARARPPECHDVETDRRTDRGVRGAS